MQAGELRARWEMELCAGVPGGAGGVAELGPGAQGSCTACGPLRPLLLSPDRTVCIPAWPHPKPSLTAFHDQA